MMKKLYFVLLLFFASNIAVAQNCNCLSNLKWLIKTFEQNDAGFQYVIDKKGKKAYLLHNKSFLEKASGIKNKSECLKLLNDWTEFFRKNHLQVVYSDGKSGLNFKPPTREEIINQYKNSPTYEITEEEFYKYSENLPNTPGFEGVWILPPYTLGIIKDTASNRYVGFILKSESPYWQKNQIKLIIEEKENGKYDMTYFMRDHSERKIKNIELVENYLLAEPLFIKRIIPKSDKSNPDLEFFFKTINAEKPFIEKLSENTIYFRIPSFSPLQKKEIDSLLAEYDKIIKTTEYLIIDLRNNGGGSDNSYAKIIPYIYTNPVRVVGVELLPTELNNKRMLDFINSPYLDKSMKEWARKGFEKLQKHLGEFVNLDDSIVSVITYDSVYKYPKNVAILINGNCVSTTEQFLLAAKQSKKVKLFGATTLGSLDISNMNSVIFPCGDFKLWYAISKSYRIPDMAIDGKGIQPDYYFDRTIKPYEWIKQTEEILNYRQRK